MRLFAISDLHLSLGVDKPMDIFGPQWVGHGLADARAVGVASCAGHQPLRIERCRLRQVAQQLALVLCVEQEGVVHAVQLELHGQVAGQFRAQGPQ